MFEIVVSGIGGRSFQVAQDGFGMLKRELMQETAAALPKLEVGHLDQVLDQALRIRSPQASRAHDGEADGFPNAGDEFFPSLIIRSTSAERNDVFQGQG